MASSPEQEPAATPTHDSFTDQGTTGGWFARLWRDMWITYGILWAVILATAGTRWLIPKLVAMSFDDWLPLIILAAFVPPAAYVQLRKAGLAGRWQARPPPRTAPRTIPA